MPRSTHDGFVRDLEREIRGDVAADGVTRGIYATDASNYQIMPVAVVVPLDDDDVRAACRLAAEHGVSILLRGGGTSLAGQTTGASLVIDVSKHLNRILDVNVREHWARVQPGVVRDELNAALARHRLHLAIDPATGNRANVGGMIANNSSGMRSLVYGKMIDHLLEARVLLAGGEELLLRELDPVSYAEKAGGTGREAEIYRGFRRVIEENRDEIGRRFPKIMRRVSGYPLDEFVGTDRWNLSKLICGSEGTLATVLDATVRLEPLPPASSVAIVHFHDLFDALSSVPAILNHGPSAVELLDDTLIARARESRGLARLCDFVDGDPAAVLAVEFLGEAPEAAAERARELQRDLDRRGIGHRCLLRLDAEAQARVWKVRKSGLGLMLRVRGDRKPLSFIEDAAVPVEALPEYIRRLQAICERNGTTMVLYAHASVGVLHVKPIVDLKRQDDIARMRAISEAALEAVIQLGGSWSGEHGDGLSRGEFLERFFGPRVYAAFREVKRLFDPRGLMNPGKIVDAPPMDQNLRFGTRYRTPALETVFHYRDDGGFAAAVEMCNGVGACRQTLAGTMCPSYIATRDEAHTTRGRANALRLAMSGQLGTDALTSRGLYDVLDLCLGCKACKSECPSSVDMARLKSEFLRMYRARHGAARRDRLVAGSPSTAARLAGALAPIVNAVQNFAPVRGAIAAVTGFTPRRRLPAYAREPFAAWFDRRPRGGAAGSVALSATAAGTPLGGAAEGPATGTARGGASRRVVLFDDTYLNYHEPRVGQAAVELLASCGYDVTLARAGCCQRPRISHGFLDEARRDGERTLRNLDRFLVEGVPVVACEPSCAAALVDDLPDLIDDEALGRRTREGILMIDQFVAREVAAGRIAPRFVSPVGSVLVHGHCHQKAIFGTETMMDTLRRVPDLEAREIDAGCCGMAGSFGYEREHYDLSMTIGEDRLFPAIRSLGAETAVVACGFSCRHQIAHATGRRAVHWVEIVRAEPETRRVG